MKTAESNQAPARLIESGGKIQYTFGAVQGTRDGQPRFTYFYVEIDPPVTRQKIYAALKEDGIEITAFDAPDIDAEYALIDARLAEIGDLTWNQLDDHVDSVFGSLSVAQKTSLKRLYKCVLALIKIR